jgi:hypothetical protein
MSVLVFTDQKFYSKLVRHFGDESIRCFAPRAEDARPDKLLAGKPGGTRILMYYYSSETGDGLTPVKDHINLSAENPLIGFSGEPRFPDMSRVYSEVGDDGVIVVQGNHEKLNSFPEQTVSVSSGVWEAIALAHQGKTIQAWVTSSNAAVLAALKEISQLNPVL